MQPCENCKCNITEKFASGRFCSILCSRSFSTKAKRKEINEKVSKKLIGSIFSEDRRSKLSKHWKEYWATPKPEHRAKLTDARRKSKKNTRSSGLNASKPCMSCGETGAVMKYSKLCTPCKMIKVPNYRQLCDFTFSVYDYPDKFDLTLIKTHGWYSPSNHGNNLNGVSKDHLYSVSEGFKNGIDPKLLSHPANCSLILHIENLRKNKNCYITLEELECKIRDWDNETVVQIHSSPQNTQKHE